MSNPLDRTITLAFGRSAHDKDGWNNKTPGTAHDFLSWLETADPKSHKKDGWAYLQGALASGGTQRHAKKMATMEVVAFDVESGDAPEKIAENARALGIDVVIHPSFSDGKSETRVDTDAVHKYARIGHDAEATDAQVLDYLRERKGYLPAMIATAEFKGRAGREYVVTHPPLPRFRVVAAWSKPVNLEAFSTFEATKAKWAAVYRAVGRKLGIERFDESCMDLSRLFYAHRRPEGAKHWAIRTGGDALDFDAILAEALAGDGTTSAEDAKPEAVKSEYQTEGLGKFFAICAKHFLAADFLLAHGDDPAEANGGVHARCPNEDAHTEADPPGKRPLWAVNASDAQVGVFVLKCQHQTCKSTLKGPHYIDLLCQAHELTVDDLVRDFTDEEGQKAWQDSVDNSFSVDQDGKPYPTQRNIKLALRKLGVGLSFNVFNGKTIISRDDHEEILQDHHVIDVWLEIDRTERFKPSKEFFFDVVGSIARERKFHPVCDYLDGAQAQWDGVSRVEGLFSKYFGAADTEFNRAAAKCWMVAAVRRVRSPGVKFDEMIVVESPQGKGKSSAFAALAVQPAWFSDNLALGAKSKEVIELTQGKWIIEIAELHGMRKAEIERVKAQLSRQFDEARLAYGRITEHVPRQFVFCGTSNNKSYLKDATGNRRFWPVETGDIDLDALKRDVDQLWGEAATLEAAGESIRLDKALWGVAAEEQEQRQIENPFFDVLRLHFEEKDGRVRSLDVYDILGIGLERRSPAVIEQVQAAMEKLGWNKKAVVRFGKEPSTSGFVKGDGRRMWKWCELGLKEVPKTDALPSVKRGTRYQQVLDKLKV
jgi:hypothetical protein